VPSFCRVSLKLHSMKGELWQKQRIRCQTHVLRLEVIGAKENKTDDLFPPHWKAQSPLMHTVYCYAGLRTDSLSEVSLNFILMFW
jgi:hypothetical protein